jgi:hypothetical protein
MTQLSEQDKQALWLSCAAGGGIGLVFGLLFGGFLIHAFIGAVFGYCLDLWGQKLDRERAPNDGTPSLRLINNARLYLAVMTVLVFIGSWQAKTWGYLDSGKAYSQGYKEGNDFGREISSRMSAGGMSSKELVDPADMLRSQWASGVRKPYPEGSSSQIQWERGYRDGMKASLR